LNATERLRRIEAIYATIPKVQCKRICGPDYCGPILMSPLELRRIKEAFPEIKPTLVRGLGFVLDGGGCDQCPLLAADGSCRAYDIRPAICRLFGAVMAATMICKHGCQPERWLTNEESAELLRSIRLLGS
jgi:uncharacterized protein